MIRIAMVEDEAAVREQLQGYIQRYTRQYGTEFAVTEFSDGVEILDAYRPVYDIVLLDVEMKHLDGMETARRIRELDRDVVLLFAAAAKGRGKAPPPRPALSGRACGGRLAAAGHRADLLYGKRRPPGAFLHRGRGVFGSRCTQDL